MKKFIVITLTVFMGIMTYAQESNLTPNVTVSGTGKLSVTPDQAIISIGAEIKDSDSSKAKSQNDEIMRKMIAFLKNSGISEKDYKTHRVQLNRIHDYQTKEDHYVASQQLVITLKNIEKYESVMTGLLQAGANQIGGVQFISSQIASYETELRKKAVDDAKKKATDYASALNQSVGKAITISDQSQPFSPRMYAMNAEMATDASTQTIAIGEIELSATVTISFELK